MSSPVRHFIHILSTEEEQRSLSVLSPVVTRRISWSVAAFGPGRPPSRTLTALGMGRRLARFGSLSMSGGLPISECLSKYEAAKCRQRFFDFE